MKELLIFYVGFTIGLCFMDYIDIKNTYNLHLYRRSIFPILPTLLLAPLVFPFQLIKAISSKSRG